MTKKGGCRTNWLRRWFVLKGTELAYYDETKKSKKGELSMTSTTDVRMSTAPTAEGHEIEIETQDRVWRLRAESEEEMHSWLMAMGSYEVWLAGGPRYVAGETDAGAKFLAGIASEMGVDGGTAAELAADEDVEHAPAEDEDEDEAAATGLTEDEDEESSADMRKSVGKKDIKRDKIEAAGAKQRKLFLKKQASWVQNAQAEGQGGFKLVGGPWTVGPGLHNDPKQVPIYVSSWTHPLA